MAQIEWEESRELEPQQSSLPAFCRENGIALPKAPAGDAPLIFIQRQALESLHDFLAHDLGREHGGVLVGRPLVDRQSGRSFVVIYSAIPAMESKGSSIHLQFTPETWTYISGIIAENYPDQVVVGWYHSHPGLGVFMSETDRATQRAFYYHPWNLAVVADPLVHKTGWFIGPDCHPASAGQVPPYNVPAGKSPSLTQLEREYRQKQDGPGWRRLLPFAFLLLGMTCLAWWIGKNRMTVKG